MIVLDTTVLVYAVGVEHPLREPARAVVEAVGSGRLRASTTVEVIQELVHVRARRSGRGDAAALGRSYAELFSPLLEVGERDLEAGLRLFERHHELGASDSVLAAAVLERGAEALVSTDRAFASVKRLPFLSLDSPELEALLS